MKIEEIIDDSYYEPDLEKTLSLAKELNPHVSTQVYTISPINPIYKTISLFRDDVMHLKEQHPDMVSEIASKLKDVMPMKYFRPGTIGSFIYGCFNEHYDPKLECAVSPFHETYENNKLYLINGLQYALVQDNKVDMYVIKEPSEKELILANSLIENPGNQIDLYDFYSRKYWKTVQVPTKSKKSKNNKYYVHLFVFLVVLIALGIGAIYLIKKYRGFKNDT